MKNFFSRAVELISEYFNHSPLVILCYQWVCIVVVIIISKFPFEALVLLIVLGTFACFWVVVIHMITKLMDRMHRRR